MGKTILEVFPTLEPYWIETFGRVALTGRPEHFEAFAAAVGVWFEVSAFRPAPNQYACTFSDITERKRAEEALRESEERHRELFETMAQGVVYQDAAGKITSANPAAERILGLSLNQMQGRTSVDPQWETLHEDGSAFPGETHPAMIALKIGKTVSNIIMGVYHPGQDTHVWININAVPLFRPGEVTPYQVHTTFEDITERIQAEETLRESEEKYRLLVENADAAIFLVDKKGTCLFVNTKAAEWAGGKPEDFIGKSLQDTLPKERADANLKELNEVMDSGIAMHSERHEERLDRWFSYHLAPFYRNGAIFGVLGIARDITEHKRMEAELQKSQKLESLGVLAGGIAHDFNNLLGGMFGFVDLALVDSSESKVKKRLSMAMGAMERARGLTQQLLTFAKGGDPVKSIAPLVSFLQETATFALSGSDIACTFDIPSDLWACDYDNTQLGQAIDNIVINAQQAMPSGGSIRITAANVRIADGEHAVLQGGRYAKISIADTGIGIPENIISRVFDPFFTTKQKGSGLGLATSYSTVKRHGGIIDVESEQGKGTTFQVFLPAAKGTPAKTDAKPQEKQSRGSGRILIMDDEEVVREMISETLSERGFDPVCVKDGQLALDEFRDAIQRGAPFRAIILDLTVPGGMGGKEAVSEIRKTDKDTPVFVASGYAEDPAVARPRDLGFTASIRKPFRIAELMRMLEEHLPGVSD